MTNVRLTITTSIDGFVAGPDQSLEDPLGVGGMALHAWALELAAWRSQHGLEGGEVNASTAVVEKNVASTGATVMGRKMFGGPPGPWPDDPWNGWWGDDPPFHHAVFVVTHHPRAPLVCQGGTTFTFVTDGVAAAVELARAAAGERDVNVAGGASIGNQCLAADLVDELHLTVSPVFLGDGERLLADLGVGSPQLAHRETIAAPRAVHYLFDRAR
jgi:dihydrofolate reductase